MTRRILVTGSRNWTDPYVIAHALLAARNDTSLPATGPMLLVHGDCPTGADKIANTYARLWGWEIEPHPADWSTHGRAAGPIRNKEMVDLGADLCLAFLRPDSRGTVDCARRAEAAGIPVVRYYEEEA